MCVCVSVCACFATLKYCQYSVSLSYCSLCQQLLLGLKLWIDNIVTWLCEFSKCQTVAIPIPTYLFYMFLFSAGDGCKLIRECAGLGVSYLNTIWGIRFHCSCPENSLCTNMPPSQFNESCFSGRSISCTWRQPRQPFMMSCTYCSLWRGSVPLLCQLARRHMIELFYEHWSFQQLFLHFHDTVFNIWKSRRPLTQHFARNFYARRFSADTIRIRNMPITTFNTCQKSSILYPLHHPPYHHPHHPLLGEPSGFPDLGLVLLIPNRPFGQGFIECIESDFVHPRFLNLVFFPVGFMNFMPFLFRFSVLLIVFHFCLK